jgi:hypothetical protein
MKSYTTEISSHVNHAPVVDSQQPDLGFGDQLPDISEEEAIALTNNKLDQLAMWDGLGVQLSES